jgi:hypothetical protein
MKTIKLYYTHKGIYSNYTNFVTFSGKGVDNGRILTMDSGSGSGKGIEAGFENGCGYGIGKGWGLIIEQELENEKQENNKAVLQAPVRRVRAWRHIWQRILLWLRYAVQRH